jgi:hypothetical protein
MKEPVEPLTRDHEASSDDHPDWDSLYPPDPEIMVSAEGDTKGLAELKQAARAHIEGLSKR